jgi:hypothetical protein
MPEDYHLHLIPELAQGAARFLTDASIWSSSEAPHCGASKWAELEANANTQLDIAGRRP